MVSPAQLFSCGTYAELLWFNCNEVEGGRELQSLQRPTPACTVILDMLTGDVIALFLGYYVSQLQFPLYDLKSITLLQGYGIDKKA